MIPEEGRREGLPSKKGRKGRSVSSDIWPTGGEGEGAGQERSLAKDLEWKLNEGRDGCQSSLPYYPQI